MTAETLAERMVAHERLELRYELGVHTELEVGGDSVLEHTEPKVLQPVDFCLRKVL